MLLVCLLGADRELGGRSKDGTMQVKDQVYTYGNRALQVCLLSCPCSFLVSRQPMHVIRGYRLHSKYAPNNGYARPPLYHRNARQILDVPRV